MKSYGICFSPSDLFHSAGYPLGYMATLFTEHLVFAWQGVLLCFKDIKKRSPKGVYISKRDRYTNNGKLKVILPVIREQYKMVAGWRKWKYCCGTISKSDMKVFGMEFECSKGY